MSDGRRARRRGAHQAKAEPRHRRNGGRRSNSKAGVHRIAREALELTGPLDAELWGSSLLGVLWAHREALPAEASADYAHELGRPLIAELVAIGGSGARMALEVIATVDDGALGRHARDRRDELLNLDEHTLPSWISELGKATITGGAIMRDAVFDDARTVFLEARHPRDEVHSLGVLIDNNIGVRAKDIVLADSLDLIEEVVREQPSPDVVLELERVAPGVAAGEIHAAMEQTDLTWVPPVSDDYIALRALAVMRADQTPDYVVAPERCAMSPGQRDRLQKRFLASPEGRQLALDEVARSVPAMVIDFCVDYVDGRPLRWSPALVEIFMADWVPTHVIGDPQLYERLPTALDAWVRFAGRRSNLPEWAVGATREEIPIWRDEMVRCSTDPAAGDFIVERDG